MSTRCTSVYSAHINQHSFNRYTASIATHKRVRQAKFLALWLKSHISLAFFVLRLQFYCFGLIYIFFIQFFRNKYTSLLTQYLQGQEGGGSVLVEGDLDEQTKKSSGNSSELRYIFSKLSINNRHRYEVLKRKHPKLPRVSR